MNDFFLIGDSPYFNPTRLHEIQWFPAVWNEEEGLGMTNIARLWIDYPFRVIVKILATAHLSWFLIEKILWVFALCLGILGVMKMLRYFGRSRLFAVVGTVVFFFNTYSILLIAGGQFGVFLGYCFVPWVIYWIQNIFDKGMMKIMLIGLGIAGAYMADLRMALISSCSGLFLLVPTVCVSQKKNRWIMFLGSILTVSLIVLGVHSFWLVPFALYPPSNIAGALNATGGMATFLSFADFSHALSLLHPNWPENLFGKVYFLQPEFLILPIIAFGGMLFLIRKKMSHGSYAYLFSLLALMGAFFAKGTNPPFGTLYLFFVDHIPGGSLFRDPTKFYAFISISYTYLIARFGDQICDYLQRQKCLKRYIIALCFILFIFFLVRPLWNGSVLHMYQRSHEYAELENVELQEKRFIRTLWIPTTETFSPLAATTPTITAEELFGESSPSAIRRIFSDNLIGNKLASYGIQYIVLPADERRSIYLSHYTFDPSIRNEYEKAILDNPNFKKIDSFSHISVYRNVQVSQPLLSSNGKPIAYTHPSSGTYIIDKTIQLKDIHFLFHFDPYWVLTDGTENRYPIRDENGFMLFQADGMQNSLSLIYLPEKASMGLVIMIGIISLSGIVIVSCMRMEGKKRT